MTESPPSQPPQNLAQPAWLSTVGIMLFIALCTALFVLLNGSKLPHGNEVGLAEFRSFLEKGKVKEITISDDEGEVRGLLTSASSPSDPDGWFHVNLPSHAVRDWGFISWVLEHRNGADVKFRRLGAPADVLFWKALPWALLGLVVLLLGSRWLRRASQKMSEKLAKREPVPVIVVGGEKP